MPMSPMQKNAILFSVLLASSSAFSNESPVQHAWRLSGFIAPTKTKQWMSISEGKIVCIDDEVKPGVIPEAKNCVSGFDVTSLKDVTAISTEDSIFPGMMDLHNHIEFNSLPLWTDAQGQFKNRFEWRESESYQKGPHKFFMRLMKLDPKDPDYATFSDFNCLSLQWAEIKALAGGVTAIQGMGRIQNSTCTKDFGIRNLEIASTMDLKDTTITGSIEVLNPETIQKGFNVFIRPQINKEMTNYREALGAFDEHFEISNWLTDFKTKEHTIENGILLAVGPMAKKYLNDQVKLTEETAVPMIKNILASETQTLKITDVESASARVLAWLFEPNIEKVSYMDISPTNPDIEKLALAFLSPDKYDRTAMKSDAVLYIPRDARDYMASFELGTLTSLRKKLLLPKTQSFLTHLGEGRRTDEYNSQEYNYANTLGLLTPNFVSIHGVGFSEDNFHDMGTRGNGLVVSPFSNLLLYGESVRIKAAVQNKVILALGSDWSVSGTKNLLDEAKVLKKYSSKEGVTLTNQQLAEMLTINPAKLLKLDTDQGFGRIALGRQADFILLSTKPRDAYTSLIDSKSENIELVTVKGEPLYGNADLLSKVALGLGDTVAPESLNDFLGSDPSCAPLKASNKAFRLFSWADSKTRFSVREIKSKLDQRFKEASEKYKATMNAEGLSLDPIYSCQDPGYRSALSRLLK